MVGWRQYFGNHNGDFLLVDNIFLGNTFPGVTQTHREKNNYVNCELTDGLSGCRQQQKQHQPGASPHSDHAMRHDEGCDIIGWWLKDTGV